MKHPERLRSQNHDNVPIRRAGAHTSRVGFLFRIGLLSGPHDRTAHQPGRERTEAPAASLSFGGTIFAIVASKLLADFLAAPFDLIVVLAVELAALAAFLAIAT